MDPRRLPSPGNRGWWTAAILKPRPGDRKRAGQPAPCPYKKRGNILLPSPPPWGERGVFCPRVLSDGRLADPPGNFFAKRGGFPGAASLSKTVRHANVPRRSDGEPLRTQRANDWLAPAARLLGSSAGRGKGDLSWCS